MKTFIFEKILIISAIAAIDEVKAKIYEDCQLANDLVNLYRFPREKICDWICLIYWESMFDTEVIGTLNLDGSKDHGIFQINDLYWCKEGEIEGACGINCSSLRDDDIKDDAVCARRIFRVTERRSGNGFNAWAAWKTHCENQDVNSYLKNCTIQDMEKIRFRK